MIPEESPYTTIITIDHDNRVTHSTEVNYHTECNKDRTTKVYGGKQ